MSEKDEVKQRFQFVTGNAGTGKTYGIKQQIAKNPKWALLTATTGIAAINLSGAHDSQTITTINGALKYSDTKSLEDSAAMGYLEKNLLRVALMYRRLAVDEASMLGKRPLDLICRAVEQVNEDERVIARGGFGLVLVGDFCQLPPIKDGYAFKSGYWEQFKVIRLTKSWRQAKGEFLNAINAARCGDGKLCAELLDSTETKWLDVADSLYDGTTIMSKNDEVDNFNEVNLSRLIGKGNKRITLKNYRWGKQKPEWKNIPEELYLAENAYVMILSNNSPSYTWVNGDCGHIKDAHETRRSLDIQLTRNGKIETIGFVRRYCTQSEVPDGMLEPIWLSSKKKYREWLDDEGVTVDNLDSTYKLYLENLTMTSIKERTTPFTPYFDFTQKCWIVGEVNYVPVRLAYATTCHKSQGLSLDRVQINYNNQFFGSPAMSYVALSRCRSAAGLTIVGNPGLIEARTNISREVVEWL